jgi:hypothetical protein
LCKCGAGEKQGTLQPHQLLQVEKVLEWLGQVHSQNDNGHFTFLCDEKGVPKKEVGKALEMLKDPLLGVVLANKETNTSFLHLCVRANAVELIRCALPLVAKNMIHEICQNDGLSVLSQCVQLGREEVQQSTSVSFILSNICLFSVCKCFLKTNLVSVSTLLTKRLALHLTSCVMI